MASVKIGPKFFHNEFKEYACWQTAYIREAAQNCLDAPHSDKVAFVVSKQGDNTIIIFENNGDPMTEDILVDKLLALAMSLFQATL